MTKDKFTSIIFYVGIITTVLTGMFVLWLSFFPLIIYAGIVNIIVLILLYLSEHHYKRKVIFRDDNTPYLIRHTLFTCKYFSFKVHHILRSDYDCLHDHPWPFFTFLIKGAYVEYTPTGSKVYSRFSLLYRHKEYVHRLEIHQPVISLVLTLKKCRKWGFFTKAGWVEWFNYTGSEACE